MSDAPASAVGVPSLASEWARVSVLLSIAEAVRTGASLPDDLGATFAELNTLVATQREEGSWRSLQQLVDQSRAQGLIKLDLDILAVALAGEAIPAMAPRIQSLQPHIGSPWPSLALLQEVLMLEDPAEADILLERLAPAAPLTAAGLIRVEGEGAYQTVRPGQGTGLAVLGRSLEASTPAGTTLITRNASFAELVAPAATLAALRDFVAWVKFSAQVRQWGGRRSGGPLALFNGASGVGKSFAAAVVAGELSAATGEPWALYVLDLGRIMSKYVGETEKNINRLLDAMAGRRAILQIDEADGLLGKRGDISDARDRYSNLEVSHMLSRFESHDGPVILTTNLRSNIDGAFLRRFQIIVDFPAPDSASRARLWALLLPPSAPRDSDVSTDALGDAVKLAGGSIQNAATYAAVLAARDERPISNRHLARAVFAELSKENRPVRQSELGYLAGHLEPVA